MILNKPLQSLSHITVKAMLFLFCWALLGSSITQAQETKLAWQLKQGDQFLVDTTKLSKRTSMLDSRLATTITDVAIGFGWTVDSVDAGGTATITQTLKNFSISISDPAVPSQALAYSSDIPPEELPTAMRKLQRKSKPLVGLKCILEMTSNGEITSVRIDAANQKKLDKLETSPNLQALFSKASLEKLSKDLSITAIPRDADPTGWSKTETQSSGFGEISVDHKFSVGSSQTVKGREQIKIDVTSSLTPTATENAPEKSTAKNEISQSLRSLTGNGTITFDVDGGYFSNSQFETKIKSERKYREKLILTSIENETRIKIEKQ